MTLHKVGGHFLTVVQFIGDVDAIDGDGFGIFGMGRVDELNSLFE